MLLDKNENETCVETSTPDEPSNIRDDTDRLVSLNTVVKSTLTNYYQNIGTDTPKKVYRLVMAEVEPALIMTTLTCTEGNQSKAARILGVSRRWFLLRCAYYNIFLDPTRPDGYAFHNTD